MKTLKTFLEKHNACADGFEFAKDLTLEEFLKTCQRGDWILWLFAKTNPESLRELTLAKAHCANTVKHLMTDPRSLNAVDVAFAFGEGRATREDLVAAAADAHTTAAAALAAFYAADAALAAADAHATAAAAAYAAWNFEDGRGDGDATSDALKQNRKQTADICREFLPIGIWDQSQF